MLLTILHRDDSLVAVDKPSGIAVHRGLSQERHVVLTVLRDQIGRYLYPVHRLDRGTSGALVMALDSGTARGLQERFEAGEVRKRYLALVRGIPPEEGIVDSPVPRSPDGPRVPAVTAFRRLGTFERYSLLEVFPKTGRLHQIRRHLKHISHPLIGDVKYGKGDHNRLFRERFGLHRLALHALELCVAHPDGGGELTVSAPVPPDLAEPLRAMGFDMLPAWRDGKTIG